jgi:hypothetical protein
LPYELSHHSILFSLSPFILSSLSFRPMPLSLHF